MAQNLKKTLSPNEIRVRISQFKLESGKQINQQEKDISRKNTINDL